MEAAFTKRGETRQTARDRSVVIPGPWRPPAPAGFQSIGGLAAKIVAGLTVEPYHPVGAAPDAAHLKEGAGCASPQAIAGVAPTGYCGGHPPVPAARVFKSSVAILRPRQLQLPLGPAGRVG